MKAETFLPTKQQNKQIRHHVIKGSQNIAHDANMMAEIEQQKSYQQQLAKKSRIDSFLNSTKLNASKLYKQKCQKNNEKLNTKKNLLEKQKELKQKYTVIKRMDSSKMQTEVKSKESSKNIKIEPSKVEWKKGQQKNVNIVKIPEEKLVYEEESEGDLSAVDSDVDFQKQSNPKDMLKFRQSVRNSMLNKLNTKS